MKIFQKFVKSTIISMVTLVGVLGFYFPAHAFTRTYSNYPIPGITIYQKLDGDRSYNCTLGYLAHDPQGNLYGITAGHCFHKDADPTVYFEDSDGGEHVLGHFIYGNYNTDPYTGATIRDYSVIAAHADTMTGQILNKYALSSDDAHEFVTHARPGAEVCKAGAVSGFTCGTFVKSYRTFFSVRTTDLEGDSGGAVFAPDGHGGYIALGIVTGYATHDPSVMYATYIDTAANEQNLTLYG